MQHQASSRKRRLEQQSTMRLMALTAFGMAAWLLCPSRMTVNLPSPPKVTPVGELCVRADLHVLAGGRRAVGTVRATPPLNVVMMPPLKLRADRSAVSCPSPLQQASELGVWGGGRMWRPGNALAVVYVGCYLPCWRPSSADRASRNTGSFRYFSAREQAEDARAFCRRLIPRLAQLQRRPHADGVGSASQLLPSG